MLFEAAIFDLDGVVTFTARLHAAAWKQLFDDYLRLREERFGERFVPFTDADYRAHVDGRPRLDGVRAFLAARGISLPEDASDGGDQDSVVGLGNRKNELFRKLLRERGADVDENAVRFIRELRARDIKVGVASSSRNTATVLDATGLADLFDARVDGLVSERLRLSGKPAPDSFLVCLELLGGQPPERAMIAEDAIAGVVAGKAGRFGLVVGVDRAGHAVDLRESGADWVIRDFRELSPERVNSYFANLRFARPNALAHYAPIAQRLEGRKPACFLDYDGTLTPIVARPDLATLSDPMRETLRALAAAGPTTIVSGRGREDVAALVGIAELNYAGSHGFDIAGPAIPKPHHEVEPGLAPIIAGVAEELRQLTAHIPGALVEDKKYSVAVHYRLVAEDRVGEVEHIVDAALAARPQLRKATGKKVFELRSAKDWDKGRAVLWLLQALGLDRPDVLPIYIGDDVTDEDAFRALDERGIGILVTETPRPTSAAYSLQDVSEVRAFLNKLAGLKAPVPS